MNGSAITEIELDRGQCMGTCPVFRVSLSHVGRYQYEGHRHVEPLGERSGRFPVWLFERVAEVCHALDILGLDDVYPTHMDDAPSTMVTVRHAGGVKVIRCEDGDSSVPRLWAFGIVVEHAMRLAFELEDRDHRPKRKR